MAITLNLYRRGAVGFVARLGRGMRLPRGVNSPRTRQRVSPITLTFSSYSFFDEFKAAQRYKPERAFQLNTSPD